MLGGYAQEAKADGILTECIRPDRLYQPHSCERSQCRLALGETVC